MVALKLISILILSLLMGFLTEKLLRSLEKLIKILKINKFEASALIIALATSLPEILVSILASLRNMGSLAIGNALGANIVNLSLIIGITAAAGGGLYFNHKNTIKENSYSLAYTIAPLLCLIDLKITRIEGLFLILLYVSYVYWLSKIGPKPQGVDKNENGKASILGLIVGGWVLLLLGASQLIVMLAGQVAIAFRLPEIFIGLFIVAVGTSLPELVFNLKAIAKREVSMSLGNTIGSCVANSTLVIGLASLINPITLSKFQILMPGVEYIFVMLLFLRFVFTKHRLERKEGLLLLGLFFYYTALELMFR